jgi:hypothetical protein
VDYYYYYYFFLTIVSVSQSIEKVGIQIAGSLPLTCSRRDAKIVTTYEMAALNST